MYGTEVTIGFYVLFYLFIVLILRHKQMTGCQTSYAKEKKITFLNSWIRAPQPKEGLVFLRYKGRPRVLVQPWKRDISLCSQALHPLR